MSRPRMTSAEEDELYNQLKDLPDFRCYPLPARWFKKYNIPPIEAGDTKDFIDSAYTVKMMFAPKDLPPIIINEPVKDASGNIKWVKMAEPEQVDVKVVSRPYDPDAPLLPLEDLSHLNDLSGVKILESTSNDQCEHNDEASLEPVSQEPEQQH